MKLVITIAVILSLVNVLNGACLTASQLESLGFTDVLAEPVENTGDDATCKSEAKVCIEPSKIKEQIKKNLNRCKEARNGQMKKVGERVEKDGKKMKTVAEAGSEAESDGKTKSGGKFKRPPKDGQKQKMKKFKEKCSEEDCSDLKQKFVNVADYKDCFESIAQVSCGAYCGLIGENGSENAKIDSTGKITGMKVSENTAVELFDKCSDFFQTQCSVTNVFLVFEEMGSDTEPTEKKGKSGKIRKICAKVPELDTCKDDVTKCSKELKVEFLESFISIGKSCAPGEPDENFNEGEAKLEELNTEATSSSTASSSRLLEQFTARLLEDATTDCELEVSSSGYDAFTAGQNSGIEYSEYSEYVSRITVFVFGLLSTLLK